MSVTSQFHDARYLQLTQAYRLSWREPKLRRAAWDVQASVDDSKFPSSRLLSLFLEITLSLHHGA